MEYRVGLEWLPGRDSYQITADITQAGRDTPRVKRNRVSPKKEQAQLKSPPSVSNNPTRDDVERQNCDGTQGHKMKATQRIDARK